MNLKTKTTQSGNAVVIVLVALVVIAVGALAYMSGKMTGKDKDMAAAESVQTAAAQEAGEAPAAAEEEKPQVVIKPGNPVVAKVNGQELKRSDVFNFIQTLP
ncbi:MAG: hypothetical protein ACPGRX_09720, partial [Bdellovibrionales bacterium]